MAEAKRDGGEFRQVPAQSAVRERIWREASASMAKTPRQRPLSRAELLALAPAVLQAACAPAEHLGYAMVMLNNAFWHAQYAAVPKERRLLLLPRCMAALPEISAQAQSLGYKTHVAEGSPAVLKLLAEEPMDAVLGIGCLDSLEKAFLKVRQAGVPAVAVPLNAAGCAHTEADLGLIRHFLHIQGAAVAACARNYLPLLRMTHRMFHDSEFSRLLGEEGPDCDPAVKMAQDWLRQGGKRLRPFTTLAGFAAFAPQAEVPDAVKRVALAMEAFHKASLAHDDIEDGDGTRYGRPALHCRCGVPAAINAGDYLVGLGYRLASQGAQAFGASVACRILEALSRAHVALAVGQGGELAWPEKPAPDLQLGAVLKRYMLKSSPAFEAALLSGLVLGGAGAACENSVRVFCKHLGAAFQIQNDLTDWKNDALKARPTVLMALAAEGCSEAERAGLLRPGAPVLDIYSRSHALERARELAERLRLHAAAVIDESASGGNAAFGDLLRFVLETALEPAGSTEALHAAAAS